MNDHPESVAAVGLESALITWRRAVAILAAAVALGLVYNVASPLGVRAPRGDGQPVVAPPASNPPASITTNAVVVSPAPDGTPVVPAASTLRWLEVKPLLAAGQVVLVDARAKAAYDLEHIPGAISLPAESEPAGFIAFATRYPQSTAVVVYCGGGNCDLSHQLREKLTKDLGYTNVKEMPGGIVEWRVAEGKPAPLGAP